MKWIKANEQTPELYPFNNSNENHYKLDGHRVDGFFLHSQCFEYFNNDIEGYSQLELSEFGRIEWLDETDTDNWISVEETPPKKGVPILLNTEHWIGVGFYKKNHELNIEGEPEWSEENGEYIGAKVTHWQPLPTPPKKK